MIRNVLLCGAAAVALSTAAAAADLPLRSAPPPFVPPPPVFTWTGFYIGATAGYAFNTEHNYATVGNNAATAAMEASGARPPFLRTSTDGFTGGGEIGYNYQFGGGFFGGPGGVVVGVEADAQYVDGSSHAAFVNPNPTVFQSQTNFVGTVRGRLGYGFDRFLVYGTGGFAYGDVRDQEDFINGAGTDLFTGSRSALQTGYAYGGGVEYAIPTTSFLNFFHSSAVTVKAEYLHYDLGRNTFLIPGINPATLGQSYTASVRDSGDIVRAGLNFKFQ